MLSYVHPIDLNQMDYPRTVVEHREQDYNEFRLGYFLLLFGRVLGIHVLPFSACGNEIHLDLRVLCMLSG